MKLEDISKLTDEQLQNEIKKIKPSPIFDAFFIGFMAGIVVFSVAKNSWGLVTLIPVFLIYLFLRKSKKFKVLSEELKKRNIPANN